MEESIGKEGEPEEKAGDAEEGIISKETIEPCTTVDMSSDKTTAGQWYSYALFVHEMYLFLFPPYILHDDMV